MCDPFLLISGVELWLRRRRRRRRGFAFWWPWCGSPHCELRIFEAEARFGRMGDGAEHGVKDPRRKVA